MRKKGIQYLFITIMSGFLLFAGCGKKAANMEINAVSSGSLATDSVLERNIEFYIQGMDDRYVVQNTQQIDPAQIIKAINQNNPILADVSVDTSGVDYSVPGIYSVTYCLKLNRTELKKTTDASDTAAVNREDLFEVKIKKNIVIVTLEEAQKLADEGKTVYRDNNEVLQKAETSAVPIEASAVLPEENHTEEAAQPNTDHTVQQPKRNEDAKPVQMETKPMVQTETPKLAKAPTVVHRNEPAEHAHNWVPITKVIHHDEIGHMETIQHKEEGHTERVMVKPAETKKVHDHSVFVCNCGREFESREALRAHIVETSNAGDLSHYSFSIKSVEKTITIPAEYKDQWVVDKAAWTEKKWVVDKAAWDETIVTGRRCTICGVQQ